VLELKLEARLTEIKGYLTDVWPDILSGSALQYSLSLLLADTCSCLVAKDLFS
jgi:hypothetical protein